MFRSIFFFTALILIIFMGNINAVTYYVASNGNDANSGLSTTQPWKTLAKVQSSTFLANDIVSFRCGDTFTLSANWSSPRDNMNFNSYGTGNRPIIDVNAYVIEIGNTNANHPKSDITFTNMKFINSGHGTSKASTFWIENPDYVTFESCNIDEGGAGMYVGGGNYDHSPRMVTHLTIRNSTLSNNVNSHAIYMDGVDNVLFEHDTLISNITGIRVGYGHDQLGTNNITVRYCILKNNDGYALCSDGMKNSYWYYNLIESSSIACLYMYDDAGYYDSNNSYYNNTFITHSGMTMQLGGDGIYTSITNLTFKNNIFYNDAGTNGIYFIGSSTIPTNWTFNNNLYYGIASVCYLGSDRTFSYWQNTLGYDAKGKNTNPLFTSSSNFTLQPSSPSVNAGVNVNLSQDIAGNPVVGNPDLGAYELKSPLPVELTTFSGIFINNSVRLTWSTATEVNNQGFDIERYTNSSWLKIGFIEGKGNSVIKNDYSFEDKTPVGSTIQYRLKQIDNNGNFKYYDSISVTAIPQDFAIGNYPNPFNPSTKIRYSIPSESMINLVIYNLIGERIDELKNEIQQPGTYETNWNGSGHASGIYFLSIIESPVNGSAKISKIIKMNLIK